MRAVDGVLTQEQGRELEELLELFPDCRDELEDHKGIKEVTDAMTARIAADARIEPPRPAAAARAVTGLGLLLLLASAVLLLGFAGWLFFSDTEVPMVLKVGAASGGAGLLVLLLYALNLRRRAAGRDPYREIDL